ncbi:hypothetical protein EJ06DRAFT_471848 [Trichodelitschia bisporula]|uniref:DUF3176 domain-containing protein n=1 Tax=Trichodelitschia bisporula TaxID=703511 RepID=A0A6G1I5A4_9PEZI|nr:hypothetical protein EJ06DRAFT_471848 [Trichodelitschia bisporula]
MSTGVNDGSGFQPTVGRYAGHNGPYLQTTPQLPRLPPLPVPQEPALTLSRHHLFGPTRERLAVPAPDHATTLPPPSSPHYRQQGWPAREFQFLGNTTNAIPYSQRYNPVSSPPPRSTRLVQGIRRFVIKYIVEWWLLEILSWIFSALCMSAIFGVLLYYAGRKIPNWPLGITINGFISVFSGLAKAALLLPTAEALGQLKWNWFRDGKRPMIDFERIDMASRGPWGAFILLGRMRGMTLPSIGAAIVLLAPPLDIFFQQMVSYPSAFVPGPTNGTISRVLAYDPLDGVNFRNGVKKILPPRDYSFAEQLLFTNGSALEPNFNCPTSNCTWEPFETLGVCSKCADVSQDVYFRCQNGTGEWMSNVSSTDPYPNVAMCGYFLNLPKSPPVFLSGYAVDASGKPGEAMSTQILSFSNTSSRLPLYGGSMRFKYVRSPIWDLLVSGTPGGIAGAYGAVKPEVNECIFYFCAKTVQSGAYWGRLSENVAKEVPLDASEPYPWIVVDPVKNLVRYLAEFNLELPSHGDQAALQNNTFFVSNLTAVKTALLIDEIAPSYVTALNASVAPLLKYDNALRFGGSLIEANPQTNPWMPPNNITAHAERLAATLTSTFRNTREGEGDVEMVLGIAWEEKTFISFRWVWFIMPVALLFFSLIFLVATVIRSSRDEPDVGILKTSTIAVLFNGLGKDVQEEVRPNCPISEVKARARELKVTLRASGISTPGL